MSRKIVAFLLITGFILSFSACNGNNGKESDEKTTTTTAATESTAATTDLSVQVNASGALSEEGKAKFLNRTISEKDALSIVPVETLDDIISVSDEIIYGAVKKLEKPFKDGKVQAYTLQVIQKYYGELNPGDEIIFFSNEDWYNNNDRYVFFLQKDELDSYPQTVYKMAEKNLMLPDRQSGNLFEDAHNKKFLSKVKTIDQLKKYIKDHPKKQNPIKRGDVTFIESGDIKEMVNFADEILLIKIVEPEQRLDIFKDNDYFRWVYYLPVKYLKGDKSVEESPGETNMTVLNSVKLETGKEYLVLLKNWENVGTLKVSRENAFFEKDSEGYNKILGLLK